AGMKIESEPDGRVAPLSSGPHSARQVTEQNAVRQIAMRVQVQRIDQLGVWLRRFQGVEVATPHLDRADGRPYLISLVPTRANRRLNPPGDGLLSSSIPIQA